MSIQEPQSSFWSKSWSALSTGVKYAGVGLKKGTLGVLWIAKGTSSLVFDGAALLEYYLTQQGGKPPETRALERTHVIKPFSGFPDDSTKRTREVARGVIIIGGEEIPTVNRETGSPILIEKEPPEITEPSQTYTSFMKLASTLPEVRIKEETSTTEGNPPPPPLPGTPPPPPPPPPPPGGQGPKQAERLGLTDQEFDDCRARYKDGYQALSDTVRLQKQLLQRGVRSSHRSEIDKYEALIAKKEENLAKLKDADESIEAIKTRLSVFNSFISDRSVDEIILTRGESKFRIPKSRVVNEEWVEKLEEDLSREELTRDSLIENINDLTKKIYEQHQIPLSYSYERGGLHFEGSMTVGEFSHQLKTELKEMEEKFLEVKRTCVLLGVPIEKEKEKDEVQQKEDAKKRSNDFKEQLRGTLEQPKASNLGLYEIALPSKEAFPRQKI